MGDVSTGDGKDKRYKKKYTLQIIEYANQALCETERSMYDVIMNELVSVNKLVEVQDLMLADLVSFDYIRAKRLQVYIKDTGDMISIVTRSGQTVEKVNEASYLLNAVQGQLRQNLKELTLTRKEQVKKRIEGGHFDFAKMMSKEKIIDVEDEDTKQPEDKKE